MKNILLLGALALSFVPMVAVSQQPERLVAGRTIERTITVGQKHSFALTVDSGRFVVGEAVQHGIDVQVAIVTPAGDTLAKFDSPNGSEGPEPFTFTTKAKGDYQVVVAPFTTATGTGRYTLVLKRVVAAATTPAGKVDQLMANVDPAGPGVVVAVVRDGKTAYQKSWGLANLTHKVPFTVNTITNIGSTSKQFTTFAILMLAHQNKLSIDDDVRNTSRSCPISVRPSRSGI